MKNIKKFFALIICVTMTLAVLAACNGGGDEIFVPVEKVGEAPAYLEGNVLDRHLLLNGVPTKGGVLLGNTAANAVEKYSPDGDLLWSQQYPFFGEGNAVMIITPMENGEFLLAYDIATYQKPNGQWVISDTVLAKCDSDGALLWDYNFAGYTDGIVQHVFVNAEGNIITLGSGGKYLDPASGSPESEKDDIFLALFAPQGTKLIDKKYGGMDFDTLWGNAAYIKGAGVAALISTQSKGGSFDASKSGKPVHVLAMFDDYLELKWHNVFEEFISIESPIFTEKAAYLLDSDNNLLKYNFSGEMLVVRGIAPVEQSGVRLAANSRFGQFVQTKTQIFILDDFTETLRFDFDAGAALAVVDGEDGFVIISDNIIGEEPASPKSSTIRYITEIVYSGYTDAGELLWRIAEK
ncbi:MAG: hypothetical protein FWG82_03905 [Oscillospiraceae bacterium]|nr:hypothetical protein [Oscillospiraceae bacterium]